MLADNRKLCGKVEETVEADTMYPATQLGEEEATSKDWACLFSHLISLPGLKLISPGKRSTATLDQGLEPERALQHARKGYLVSLA